MVDAFNIVQDRIARSRLAGDPPDAMISPRLQDIGLFDFHRAEQAIQCGVESVERQLDDLTRELETHGRKRPQTQLERARTQAGILADEESQPVAK
jgi:NTE family protein